MPSNDSPIEEGKSYDIISSILNESPFKLRPDDEKLAILQKGRPLPNLNIIKRDSTRNCNTSFQFSWYNVHNWLCGSTSYNKLFCWPCLLMRPETSSWCSIGNDHIRRFTSLAAKHSVCKSHLKAIAEYDETLTKLGLNPEFTSELKSNCKEDDESSSDKSETDNLIDLHFNESEKKESAKDIKNNSRTQLIKPLEGVTNTAEHKKTTTIPKVTTNITFKAWKEISGNSFPVSKSKFLQDMRLYKWKKKIAHQELKNAKLTGEKLKWEIEVLKAKMEYYKSLKEAEKNQTVDFATSS